MGHGETREGDGGVRYRAEKNDVRRKTQKG